MGFLSLRAYISVVCIWATYHITVVATFHATDHASKQVEVLRVPGRQSYVLFETFLYGIELRFGYNWLFYYYRKFYPRLGSENLQDDFPYE